MLYVKNFFFAFGHMTSDRIGNTFWGRFSDQGVVWTISFQKNEQVKLESNLPQNDSLLDQGKRVNSVLAVFE